jgi:hypothetical protein
MIEQKPQNLLLVALLVIVTLATAGIEGYLTLSHQGFPWISFPHLSFFFGFVLILGFAVAFWMACRISTARLLAMIVVIFIIEYIKEDIGIQAGLWVYHSPHTPPSYTIGVWGWVLVGMAVFWFAVRFVIRGMRKLTAGMSRRWDLVNPVMVVLIFALIPLTLGPYGDVLQNHKWQTGQCWFWGLYVILFLVTLITALRLEFPVFLGLLLTTWIFGFPSEYAGSVPLPPAWTFTTFSSCGEPALPPLFLILGCWPLEIFTQYALAALLADELLNKYTYSKGRASNHE